MRLEPVENESDSSKNPNSPLVYKTICSESLLKWTPIIVEQNKYSAAKSRSDTASILFCETLAKPSDLANLTRSTGTGVPANAPEPSGNIETRLTRSAR